MTNIPHGLFILLVLSRITQGAIRISNLIPQSGSVVPLQAGTVTFRATVRDTRNSIRNVVLDLRANGRAQYRPFPQMDRVNGTNRYEYAVHGLIEDVRYCFRVRGRNSKNRIMWSLSSCFTIEEGLSTGITYGLQPDCFENDQGKFSICLDLTSPSGEVEPFMSAFVEAREIWESIVASNGVYFTQTGALNTAYTATGSYPSIIDGVYIASNTASIDGEGRVLGAAGYVYVFRDGALWRALTGIMFLDADDLEWMAAEGLLEGVIAHEMGHVLGIGTLWRRNNLVNYPNGNLYLGSNVLREWTSQGCHLVDAGAPIVEMDYGAGTAGAHFDETCFAEELMTGFADEGMVLSNLTIGSLADMGYEVDYSLAEEFDLTGSCCSLTRRLGDTRKEFTRRRLSPENEKRAIEYGKATLAKLQEDMGLHELDPGFAIADTITVFVKQNGYIIDHDVHLDTGRIQNLPDDTLH